MLGTPVIVTPCESFLEVGIKDGENGFVLDWDMNNIDVDKIYNSKLEFKYDPPKTKWNTLLGNKRSHYIPDYLYNAKVIVKKSIDNYYDTQFKRMKYYHEGEFIVNKERADELVNAGVCDLLEVYPPQKIK